jgi:hypothetical protein
MFMQLNNQIQTRCDQINRELTALQSRRMMLENQQTRLNLLNQFQQKGVTRLDYAGFQPVSRRLF